MTILPRYAHSGPRIGRQRLGLAPRRCAGKDFPQENAAGINSVAACAQRTRHSSLTHPSKSARAAHRRRTATPSKAGFTLRHTPSGICVTVVSTDMVALQKANGLIREDRASMLRHQPRRAELTVGQVADPGPQRVRHTAHEDDSHGCYCTSPRVSASGDWYTLRPLQLAALVPDRGALHEVPVLAGGECAVKQRARRRLGTRADTGHTRS
jgi:hypothetical protein